ncbi:shieldin complex subunit 2 isoform X3 [Trichechus manatus latirostris]|uniref:Shieldin complex subunit 2 isoform X3 n=1 Tax=Trichechus manatus latirostris TaxID=127582 RepID=A0A2Y9RR99_TRIMA|nr:shieldin complex subunit 2 isoform X3 [Trichechus manatus latirostris]
MMGGSQVYIFWGAPVLPLKMTVSQEPTSVIPTADPWKKIQLLYSQHSLHLKDEKYKHKNPENYQVLDNIDPLGLNSHCSLSSRKRSVHLKDDLICCISETQNIKSQKCSPSGMNGLTDSSVQVCGFKSRVQHVTGEEKNQKLVTENKKITVEQHQEQSSICAPNLTKTPLQLGHKCAAILDLVCSTKQINIGPEAVETTYVPRVHHEMQNLCVEFLFSKTVDKPRSKRGVKKVSNLKISTDTEFLSIMTSSQVAFLAQRKCKGQNSLNKETINMEIGPKASHEEVRGTEDNLIQHSDDFAEGYKSGQNEAYSLELFSPVGPETKNNHILINSDTNLEENIGSQELFSPEETLPPNEICIESFSSGILCSQLNTFHKISIERSLISEDKLGHSKAPSKGFQVSKKTKLLSNARDLAVTLDRRNVSEFKYIKKTSLIKNCNCKSQKYNCLVMVLSPCHVKEVNIKSGPPSGSAVPVAATTVIDQSEIKKKVFMWRTAAFWALTVFPGDIILLTDVTVHEDQWVGETVLQSTFTSQLLNLGSYSSVEPEEYYIWKFKYLFVQRNCILENLELHTTPWSSCECLFDDDIRAIKFKAKFQTSAPSLVKMSDLAAHLEDKCSGVVLIKAQILELVFPITAVQKKQITLNVHSSLKSIFSSLPNIIYTGCAKCGLELETDENKIYKQCFSCLPFAVKKMYYRPALMTVVDGRHNVSIQVGSELIEKILLNIPPDWLNRVIVSSSGITYGMVAADLLHAFLALSEAPCLLKIQSLFVLDENSYPLQQDFYLLDFYPDNVKHDPTP